MAHRILVVDDEPHIREGDQLCPGAERHERHHGAQRYRGTNGLRARRHRSGGARYRHAGNGGFSHRPTSGVNLELPDTFPLRPRRRDRTACLTSEIGRRRITSPAVQSARNGVLGHPGILKRTSGAEVGPARLLLLGPVRLDRNGHSVTVDGVDVALTGLEFAILEVLLTRPTMVLSREQLMAAASMDPALMWPTAPSTAISAIFAPSSAASACPASSKPGAWGRLPGARRAGRARPCRPASVRNGVQASASWYFRCCCRCWRYRWRLWSGSGDSTGSPARWDQSSLARRWPWCCPQRTM